MREQVSFTIAAAVLVLAVVFWTLGVAGWNATNQASVAPPTNANDVGCRDFISRARSHISSPER